VLLGVGLSIAALDIAALAYLTLDATGQRNVREEVAKLSAQFVVIVLAGAILKLALDDVQAKRKQDDEDLREQVRKAEEARRARRAQVEEETDTRRTYVRRVLDAGHRVERARVMIQANRSVRTWSIQMETQIIEAYLELNGVTSDLVTAAEAGRRVFASDGAQEDVAAMTSFLNELIDEFGEAKKDLSELQLRAETDRKLQSIVWERLKSLPHLHQLLEFGPSYDDFRASFERAVNVMRAELRVGLAGIDAV
jgi:hypothetical protein